MEDSTELLCTQQFQTCIKQSCLSQLKHLLLCVGPRCSISISVNCFSSCLSEYQFNFSFQMCFRLSHWLATWCIKCKSTVSPIWFELMVCSSSAAGASLLPMNNSLWTRTAYVRWELLLELQMLRKLFHPSNSLCTSAQVSKWVLLCALTLILGELVLYWRKLMQRLQFSGGAFTVA